MKKILYTISLIIVATLTAATQPLDWQERRKVSDRIDDIIQTYINSAGMKDIDKGAISEALISDFTALFTEDAMVKDDICPRMGEDGLYTNEFEQKNIAAYIQDVRERYPEGIYAKVTKVNVNYKDFEKREAQITMSKEISAKTKEGDYILNIADVKLDLLISDDLATILIKQSSYENNTYTCDGANCLVIDDDDDDDDRVKKLIVDDDKVETNEGEIVKIAIGANDNSPNNKPLKNKIIIQPKNGTATIEGGFCIYTPNDGYRGRDKIIYEACSSNNQCENAVITIVVKGDSPKISFAVMGNGGMSSIGVTDIGALDYLNEIEANTRIGNLNNSGDIGFGATIELNYAFSEKIGFGIGAGYQTYKGGIELDEFHVEYESDYYNENGTNRDQAGSYRRIIDAKSIKESFTANYLTIPLLLKYKTNSGKKVDFYIHAGPVLNIPLSGKVEATGVANYEMVQHFIVSDDTFTFSTDEFNDSTRYITYDYINDESQFPEGNPSEYFEEHYQAGYDVALEETIGREDIALNQNLSVSALIRLGISISLSEKASLLIGGNFGIGPSLSAESTNNSAVGFRLTDKVGDYNSLLGISEKSGLRSYGLNIGISTGF